MTITVPEVTPFFAVPIGRLSLPDHEPLCDALEALFLARAAEGEAWRHQKYIDTMHGELFESRFDLFRWPDPPVRELAGLCHQALALHVRHLNGYDDDAMARLRFDYHAWFHVTRNGGFQGLHNHQNASWSGIFCVDPGDELPAYPESGLVRFHDPRWCSWFHSEAGNLGLKLPYHHGGFDVIHRPGRLVIFPSFLMHEIFVYRGERPRIVIAFNCSIN